jgi:hypothetical protein
MRFKGPYSMIFNSQLEIQSEDIATLQAQVAFVGMALDDRGEKICDAVAHSSIGQIFRVSFNATDMTFGIGDEIVKLRRLNESLTAKVTGVELKNVVIDATTTGVAELLYILRWISRIKRQIKVHILYAEPASYPPRSKVANDYGKHQFNLSNYSIGYKSLPGFAKTVLGDSKTHLVALLGFERVRLGQLLQNDEGAYIESITPIFGVPGFKPAYDKHSAFQNIDSLKYKGEKPQFASANNPYESYCVLRYIRECIPDEVLQIAPIGTKPMAIGACLFILQNMDAKVGIMYDHPIKTKGRTKGISKIHLYSVEM